MQQNLKEKNRPWTTAGGCRIRPLKGRSGAYTYRIEVPAAVTGKPVFKIVKSPEEAEAYASSMQIQRLNQGLSAFSMTDSERADARKALGLLKPFPNVSLTAAVEFYRKHFMPEGGDITIQELVDSYLALKEREKLRERSLSDLNCRLGRFALAFGKKLAKEIGTPDLKAWLYDDPTLAPQTKLNFRTVLHGLFGFAEAEKFIVGNPVKALPKIKMDDREPAILTLGQARSLLRAASDHPELELGPYLVFALFCGVRSEELAKLTWTTVQMKSGFVTIPPKVAKKRRIRNIPLEPNAACWLNHFGAKTGGDIRPAGFPKRFKKLLQFANEIAEAEAEAGKHAAEHFAPIPEWPHNALRHSFASYFYAKTGNAQETCARLGQKNDDVLFEHYRALARRDEGEEYFALRPPIPAAVIPLPCTAAARLSTSARASGEFPRVQDGHRLALEDSARG